MSAFTTPILIREGAACAPKRISIGAQEASFSEAWLQQQLFLFPQALPIKELAPNVQELVPICTELNTLAGPADILYVTASGQVVLVETKLWRNPEARRTVVAQILDYAKELTSWTYEDLDREVARATGKGPGHLLAKVRAAHPQIDESGFVDGINHNLRTGDIVLLIVGDGIRTGAEALVSFLERYGSLRFSFGLVEVAAFDLGDGSILLQPRILAKTEVLRRTVVIPLDQNGTELQIPAASAGEAEIGAEQAHLTEHQQWLQTFWAEYMRRLRLDESRQPLPRTIPRSSNAYFPMPPNGASSWVSAYVAKSTGQAGVYLTWAKTYMEAAAAFEYLEAAKEDIEKEVRTPLTWRRRDDGSFSIGATVDLGEQGRAEDRERVMQFLLTTTNRFVSAFRPRLEAFQRTQNA